LVYSRIQTSKLGDFTNSTQNRQTNKTVNYNKSGRKRSGSYRGGKKRKRDRGILSRRKRKKKETKKNQPIPEKQTDRK